MVAGYWAPPTFRHFPINFLAHIGDAKKNPKDSPR